MLLMLKAGKCRWLRQKKVNLFENASVYSVKDTNKQ